MDIYKKPYELFQGEELRIAELIQRRRCQMVVHSYIYYELNQNVISDHDWMEWANELRDLQEKYPEIEKQVPYRHGFENWDGSSGAFLPFSEYPGLVAQAYRLSGTPMRPIAKKSEPKPPTKKQQQSARKKLF